MLIHWSNWIITDLSSLDTDTLAIQKSMSFFEGLVKPLTIETTCKRHSSQLSEPILVECTSTSSGLAFPFPSFSDKQSEHSCPQDVVEFLCSSILCRIQELALFSHSLLF
jgi:hypothetical protein